MDTCSYNRRRGTPRWGIAQQTDRSRQLDYWGGRFSECSWAWTSNVPPCFGHRTAAGRHRRWLRERVLENEEPGTLSHVVGGYGLFGIIYSVTLQLIPRQVLRRTVRVMDIEDAVPAAARRIQEGYLFGDFQFDIDPESPDFLTKGVFSGYQPTGDGLLPPRDVKELRDEDWRELLYLAHTKKAEAFKQYARHYIATDGQLYYSDLHQLSTYLDDYHTALDQRLGAACGGSEMISELYVEPEHLIAFLRLCAQKLVARKSQVIYGTIRLINPDTETALPWAKKRWTCVIFNLHVDHTPAGILQARDAFRDLIDAALHFDGCFFLTYHRFATRDCLQPTQSSPRSWPLRRQPIQRPFSAAPGLIGYLQRFKGRLDHHAPK